MNYAGVGQLSTVKCIALVARCFSSRRDSSRRGEEVYTMLATALRVPPTIRKIMTIWLATKLALVGFPSG